MDRFATRAARTLVRLIRSIESRPPRPAVDASIVATRALNAFSPRLICMAGIRGGFQDQAPLGTLLTSAVTWERQAGNWNADGFDIRSIQERLARGHPTIGGLDMTIAQAAFSFEALFGARAPRTFDSQFRLLLVP